MKEHIDCVRRLRNKIKCNCIFNRKSVIYDGLAKYFPQVNFEESDPQLDHAGDVDYVAKIGSKAFGIQIKPVTAKANFGNYSPSERMKASFKEFEEQYGGKVFIIFSLDGEIANQTILDEIRNEIKMLSRSQQDFQ